MVIRFLWHDVSHWITATSYDKLGYETKTTYDDLKIRWHWVSGPWNLKQRCWLKFHNAFTIMFIVIFETIIALFCFNACYSISVHVIKNKFEPARDKTNKAACAPSEDSDQPGHPPSLIRVFAVHMKKPWALSYSLSAAKNLIRFGGCPGWSESSLCAYSFCWFCYVAAHFIVLVSVMENIISVCWRLVWSWKQNPIFCCVNCRQVPRVGLKFLLSYNNLRMS